jgi:hypothetical protein
VTVPPLHPELAHLGFVVGTWQGEGVGVYPTIDAFGYRDEIRLTHVGKPVLAYAERTWAVDDGSPLHSESGFWRPAPAGIEMVLAHPFGVVEVSEGEVRGTTLTVRSKALIATSTGAEIAATERRMKFDGDVLRYEIDMAASGRRLQRHLSAELHRIE